MFWINDRATVVGVIRPCPGGFSLELMLRDGGKRTEEGADRAVLESQIREQWPEARLCEK